MIFDNSTWKVFQMIAENRGTDAKAMILEAVTELLGTVVITQRTPN